MDQLTTWIAANGPLLALIAAGLLALLLLSTLLRARAAARLTAEVEAARAEARELRGEIGELNVANASLTARAERMPELVDELRRAGAALEDERRQKARLETELETLKSSFETRMEEIRGLRKEVEDRFSSLAGEVLSANSKRFLDLATERFAQHRQTAEEDLGKRQQAIAELVKPLGEKLGHFDTRIGEIEKARSEAYGAIREQVTKLAEGQANLGHETHRLVQALRAPKTRGRWGEMQLRQVFEMAGMSEHVDFRLEQSMEGDEGRQRPDAVVTIPGGKHIVIDAKTPLEGYLDALEAATPEAQAECMARHARHVRQHVKVLASKDYQSRLPSTPDFVVMFIPGETFVAAAAEADPGLIEYAFENRVLIATPTTLMALVKSIAYGWQQEKMAENAAEVQKVGQELYERLSTFADHLTRVGNALRSSVENYNKAVGSLEGRILPSARKFEALGVVPGGKSLDPASSVEVEPRQLTAPEFQD
ncbi:DNA recombination protein RmuC [Pseudoroseicyclus tamaricis]|uniref:DNA recombination protein RmuC homolog n=1 Tax=Pseudoroseicyclus tamaricis TaxID=2705421 RepID=A0A6B2K2G5_9RHOB|nr:DNA recombination protein RmuC [Pseudoroseicyclus tamaricis]NDV02754.1 DNA recombination protein RmuC [Pseudoroseicyclus tamaricis]